jgi:hypothetical protein
MRTRLQLVLIGLVVVALLLAACGAPATPAAVPTPTVAPTKAAKTINDYSGYMLRPSGTEPTNGAIKVTWYGTTMFLLDDGETQLLFDAFITRPSLETVVRSMKTGEALLQTDAPLVDAWLARPEVRNPAAIFIAHSHHDHVIDVAYIANQTGASVYGSDSTLNLARGGGVPEAQLNRNQLMKPLAIGKFTVTVLPGRHGLNPPPLPDDRDLLIDKPLPRQATPAALQVY